MLRLIIPLVCWITAATLIVIMARVNVDLPIGSGSTISLWSVSGDVVFALDTPQSILLHILIPLRLIWAVTLVPVAVAGLGFVVWRARRRQSD